MSKRPPRPFSVKGGASITLVLEFVTSAKPNTTTNGLGSKSASGHFPGGLSNSIVSLQNNSYLELLSVSGSTSITKGDASEIADFLKRHEGAMFLGINVSSAKAAADYLKAHNFDVTGPDRCVRGHRQFCLSEAMLLSAFDRSREDSFMFSFLTHPRNFVTAIALIVGGITCGSVVAQQSAGSRATEEGVKPKVKRGHAPTIGPYHLNMNTGDASKLVELTPDEKKALNPVVEFKGERIYNAPLSSKLAVRPDSPL